MKGLNCYAFSFGDPGTKKLCTLTQVKDGFCVPYVTTYGPSRPTIQMAVIGFNPEAYCLQSLSRPVTVIFVVFDSLHSFQARLADLHPRVLSRAFVSITNGRFRLQFLAPQLCNRTGLFFRFFAYFFLSRLCPRKSSGRTGGSAGQPLFSLTSLFTGVYRDTH